MKFEPSSARPGSRGRLPLRVLQLRVSMHGLHREGGDTDGDVFGAFGARSGVLDPFAGVGDYGLAGFHFQSSAIVSDFERSLQHDGELVEIRLLPGFDPSLRAAHVGDADGGSCGVYAADVFINQLGLVAGGLNAVGCEIRVGILELDRAICRRFVSRACLIESTGDL